MSNYSFEKFRSRIIDGAKKLREEHPELREGQSVFNYSEEILGGVVREVNEDCFYDDTKIEAFLSAVYKKRVIGLIEKLEGEGMLFFVLASLISADTLTSLESCKESEGSLRSFLEVIDECNIPEDKRSEYKKHIETGLDIVGKDMCLFSKGSEE